MDLRQNIDDFMMGQYIIFLKFHIILFPEK